MTIFFKGCVVLEVRTFSEVCSRLLSWTRLVQQNCAFTSCNKDKPAVPAQSAALPDLFVGNLNQ